MCDGGVAPVGENTCEKAAVWSFPAKQDGCHMVWVLSASPHYRWGILCYCFFSLLLIIIGTVTSIKDTPRECWGCLQECLDFQRKRQCEWMQDSVVVVVIRSNHVSFQKSIWQIKVISQLWFDFHMTKKKQNYHSPLDLNLVNEMWFLI